MSFSRQIKEELAQVQSKARHCQIAEFSAILGFCAQILIEYGEPTIRIHTENEWVARKCFTFLRKTFNIDTEISIRESRTLHKGSVYTMLVGKRQEVLRILQAVKVLDANLSMVSDLGQVNAMIVQRSCCKRAYLRGAFLCAGSVSDPEKFYHFEIVCLKKEKAEGLQELMRGFGMDSKIVVRKKYFVVYLKEGAQIVEILGLMEAGISLMNLENIRILKEMRNSVNRKVNCEAANINKTVSAAVKQTEDIKYICDTIGFGDLTEGLEEIARLRLNYPQASLKELGELLSPQVGKSGVNHRLRKLSNIADELRGIKEEKV